MLRKVWKYRLFLRFDDKFRRLLSTSSFCSKQKDFYAHEKLQTLDYGGVNTSSKRLYVFGSTTKGALGISTLVKPPRGSGQRVYEWVHHPVRNSFGGLREIVDVETGHGFTLAKVKSRGDEPCVFGTGLNTHSQLGYHAVRKGAPLQVIIRFAPIPLPPETKVIAVGCGGAHSVFSIQGGGLLTLGSNTEGQCGRLPIPDEEYFGSKFIHKIPAFGPSPETDVISIVSRFNTTLCLTRNGKIWSFGCNLSGQLGRGHRLFKNWEPGLVEGDLKDEKVVKISTSGNSVLAMTETGDMFGWGDNENGTVNPYDSGRIYYEPRHVPFENRIGKIKDVASGDQFSLIVNEKGEVFVWGIGECLGLGPNRFRVQKPTLIPPTLFGRHDFQPDTGVEKVFAGFFYAAAINSRGDVYTWGKNEDGCLGLRLHTRETQYFPLRVAMGGWAEKVSIGVDHTIVISRGGI